MTGDNQMIPLTIASFLEDDRYYVGTITPDASEVTISVNGIRGPFRTYEVEYAEQDNFLWMEIDGQQVNLRFKDFKLHPVTMRTTKTARTNYSVVVFLAIDKEAELAWYCLSAEMIVKETQLYDGDYIIHNQTTIHYSDTEDPNEVKLIDFDNGERLGRNTISSISDDIKVADFTSLVDEVEDGKTVQSLLKQNTYFSQLSKKEQGIVVSTAELMIKQFLQK